MFRKTPLGAVGKPVHWENSWKGATGEREACQYTRRNERGRKRKSVSLFCKATHFSWRPSVAANSWVPVFVVSLQSPPAEPPLQSALSGTLSPLCSVSNTGFVTINCVHWNPCGEGYFGAVKLPFSRPKADQIWGKSWVMRVWPMTQCLCLLEDTGQVGYTGRKKKAKR